MSKLLAFPTVIGAQSSSGAICVGVAPKKSRSKACATNLRFYNPSSRLESIKLASDVSWSDDSKTIAILLDGLRDILHQKGVVKFDRGTVSARYMGNRFYLYEVHKGMIWPRYKWWVPYQMVPWNTTISNLIFYEMWHPETLVAETDNRPPSDSLVDDPTSCVYAPLLLETTHRDWVARLMTMRG